jgi:hypothetical protein
MSLPACSYRVKYTLDIPEGPAALTLKEFAKQAEVEIVFKAASVGEIRTNAVHGLMTPEAGLDVMLSGTSLQFDVELETGAYAVTVIEAMDTAGLVDPQYHIPSSQKTTSLDRYSLYQLKNKKTF